MSKGFKFSALLLGKEALEPGNENSASSDVLERVLQSLDAFSHLNKVTDYLVEEDFTLVSQDESHLLGEDDFLGNAYFINSSKLKNNCIGFPYVIVNGDLKNEIIRVCEVIKELTLNILPKNASFEERMKHVSLRMEPIVSEVENENNIETDF